MAAKKQKKIEDLNILEKTLKNNLAKSEGVKTSDDDLENNFLDYQFYLEECFSVHGVDKFYLKYFLKYIPENTAFTYIPVLGVVDLILEKTITSYGLDRETLPIIPIREYKLVPTGNILVKTAKECFDDLKIKDYRPVRRKIHWHKSQALADLWEIKLNSIKEHYDRYSIFEANEYGQYIPEDTKKIYVIPTDYNDNEIKRGFFFSTATEAFYVMKKAIRANEFHKKYVFILEYYLVETGDFEVFDPNMSYEKRKEWRRNRTEKGRARIWKSHQKRKEKQQKEKIQNEKNNTNI